MSTDTKLESINLESLRANIALVSQDVVLFNDTVAANIAYGSAGAAEPDIWRRPSGTRDGIHRTDARGLHTLVGENGVKLSGGQRHGSRSRARCSRTRRY